MKNFNEKGEAEEMLNPLFTQIFRLKDEPLFLKKKTIFIKKWNFLQIFCFLKFVFLFVLVC